MYCPSASTPFDDIEYCPTCGRRENDWTAFDEDTCYDPEKDVYTCSPGCMRLFQAGYRWDWNMNREKNPFPCLLHLNGDKVTDPYGSLSYVCGDDEDFYCFEYAIIDNDLVLLHSVINSETGGFLMRNHYMLVTTSSAVPSAVGMFAQADVWYHLDREEGSGEFTNSVLQFVEDLKGDLNHE